MRNNHVKILAVGDAHTKYLGVTAQTVGAFQPSRGVTCVMKALGRATITEAAGFKSIPGLTEQVHEWIDSAAPDFLVFNLGQLDIEFGLPFRQSVLGDNTDARAWMLQFIEAYFTYLKGLGFPLSRIVVKGINAPVLCYDRGKSIKFINRLITEHLGDSDEDAALKEKVLADLKATYPSDIVRTDLATMFNAMLKEFAKAEGIAYFDINDELVDPESGLIKTRYVPSAFDHHIVDSLDVRVLHWQKLLPVLRRQMWV